MLDLFEFLLYDRRITLLMCYRLPEKKSSMDAEVNHAWANRLLCIIAVLEGRGILMKVNDKISPSAISAVLRCVSTVGYLSRLGNCGRSGLEMSLNDRGVNLLSMFWRERQFPSGLETCSQISKVNWKHSPSANWNQPFHELLFL